MEVSGVISTGSRLIATGGRFMTLPSEEYRLIPLTRGQFAKVSSEDYEWLNQWRWSARWNPHTKSFYAQRNTRTETGKGTTVQMHREILNLPIGDRRQGDHRNHDTLDNRRLNLRVATVYEQQFNRRKRETNKSGYKGVCKTPGASTWMAQISRNKVLHHLGCFKTKEEAYAAYCDAAQKLHDEFANLG